MFPFPVTYTDKIRDVLPADDPLAQFIVVICAQRNDMSECMRLAVEGVETDAATRAQYCHRLLASHFFEAATSLRQRSGSESRRRAHQRSPLGLTNTPKPMVGSKPNSKPS